MPTPPLRLSSKFGFIITALIVGATTLIAVLYEKNQQQNALQQAATSLEKEAQHIGDQIRNHIDNLKRDIELISQTPPIQGIIRSKQADGVDTLDGSTTSMWENRLGQIFRAVGNMYPEYLQIRYIGLADEGRELIRVERRDGRILQIPRKQLQSKAHRDYFQATMRLGPNQFYISEINLNRDFGQVTEPHTPTLRIAKPVYSNAGELFGMLVINRAIEPLFAELQQKWPATGRFYITNDQGDYLYHPDPAKRFGFDLGQRHRLQDDYPQLADLITQQRDSRELNLDMQLDGELQKLYFLRLSFDPLAPGRHLGIMLALPHRQILSSYQQQRFTSVLLIVAIGLIVLAITNLFLRRLTQPLQDLTDSAQQIADGHYNIQIPHTGSMELEVLADALRHAADDVSRREQTLDLLNHELEQRVEARTLTLQQREKSLENAQRIAGLGSWEWDLKRDLAHWSDETFRILGLNSDTTNASYPALLEQLHPEDREQVRQRIEKAIESETTFEIEHRIVTRFGAVREVVSEGEVVRDDEGRAVRLMATLLDITKRKQDEARLRLLASVFEHSLEGILITDPMMTIIEVNPAFSAITGYSAEEAIGNTPRMLSSGWHEKADYQAIWHSLETTGRWQGELTDRRKDGELYTEWLTISTVHDQHDRLVNYLGVFYDITEKKQAEQRITHLAYYDPLTELANRRLFEDRLEQSLRLARRKEQNIALLYIDLDRFKPINDSLGHKAGDLLLIQVSKRLQDCVRESDTVARLGGDEFAIVMENIEQIHVSHTAQAIIQRLGQPFSLEGSEVFIGASIGISMFPGDGADLSSLVKHADIAMYRAKERGRNTYQFFLPEMNAGVEERLFIENALRHAIERDELELYYQPQVSLQDGRYIGVEALMRWNHPQLGSVSPVRFIPIAEESGLINDIGEWALEQACHQRVAWQGKVADDFRVAVNLSARQFNSNIIGMVEKILATTGMEARHLELEITESMVMQEPTSAIQVLASLDKLGVQLAIDDFGTGYSSLSYLKRFPLHKLKVDRSFISDLPNDEEDAAITNAVIAMAHSLGLQVIAEGTETLEQIRFLRGQGCNEIQGYYCSRPLPASELNELLEQPGCPQTLE